MSWLDRSRDAAYTSPLGTRFVFNHGGDISRSFDKNTSEYNFPGLNGTYVQDLGHTDHRYPMRVIFWGEDHDLEAASFERGLKEPGLGTLEHPRDGTVTVSPFGRITIREDLIKQANQTIFEIEFLEATATVLPSGSADTASEIGQVVLATLAAAQLVFSEGIDLSSAVSTAELRNQMTATVTATRNAFAPLVAGDPVAARELDAIADSITSDITALVAIPETLSAQVTALVAVASGADVPVSNKETAYNALVGETTNGVSASINSFRTDELFAIAAVASLATSVTAAIFDTRPRAVTAAANVTAQFDTVNVWREANYGAL